MKRYLMIIMLAIMVTFCISCGKEPGNTASDKEEFTDSLTETGSGLARQVGAFGGDSDIPGRGIYFSEGRYGGYPLV